MDFENFGNLNKKQINEIAIAFINKVKELSGKEIVVYSNTYTATYVFEGEVTNYPLWVAQYGVNQPQDNGNWSSWVGWQYADDGEVNGINARVDMDKFTKEILLSDTSEIPDVENQILKETVETKAETKMVMEAKIMEIATQAEAIMKIQEQKQLL